MSGDLGGHAIGPPLPIQRVGNVLSRVRLTSKAQSGGALAWRSDNCGITYSSNWPNSFRTEYQLMDGAFGVLFVRQKRWWRSPVSCSEIPPHLNARSDLNKALRALSFFLYRYHFGECLVAATREFFLSPKQRLCACASSSLRCEGDFVRTREQEHLDYQPCKTDQFHLRAYLT